jgi:hypothetical protein
VIFSNNEKTNIVGYDARFVFVCSLVDYAALYFDGQFLTWRVARAFDNYLPEWLAFLPGLTFILLGFFLAFLGPLVAVRMAINGWKSLSDS